MSVLSDLFQNIADAIRSKTGETDTMSPAQFPGAISKIKTGVAADSFCTVTFCNYDGTILYQRYVFIGDDCPDPVEQNRISIPTKVVNGASLTWTGWNSAIDNAASSTALSNITADKTLYACFKLIGTLDDVSWAEISAASLDGTASTEFKVGDTKAITLTNSDGTTEEVLVAIAGFNLHRNTDGTKDGITFIQKGHRNATVSYNNAAVAIEDTYNLLDEDLKTVIRTSIITSGGTNGTSGINEVTNNQHLFAPELTNLSTSITNENGGTNMVVNMFGFDISMSQYTNPYDAELFPLFSGMTKKELGQFLGLTEPGLNIGTRTRFYGTYSYLYASVPARVSYSDTYSLYKWGNDKTTGNFQFCFRV